MLPPLFDETRGNIVRVATLLCVAVTCLLPLTAQSSFGASAQAELSTQEVSVSSVPVRLRVPSESIARDPFVAEAGPLPTRSMETPVGTRVRAGEDTGFESRAIHASAVLRAIILGPQSRALVEVDGTVRVLGIGDQIDGVAILAIDRTGAQLANGRHLRILGAHP